MNKQDQIIFNLSNWKYLDFKLIISVISLFLIGIITLYSANSGDINPWAHTQILRFLFFLPIFCLIIFLDIRIIYKSSYILYFIGIIMLIYVNLLGHFAMGARRWINLGFFFYYLEH